MGCDWTTLQLLGVAVLSDFSGLAIGAGLRDFVLAIAKHSSYIEEVVAMTRCSSKCPDSLSYLNYVYSLEDPTIKFHVKSGAIIEAIIPDYRENDEVNNEEILPSLKSQLNNHLDSPFMSLGLDSLTMVESKLFDEPVLSNSPRVVLLEKKQTYGSLLKNKSEVSVMSTLGLNISDTTSDETENLFRDTSNYNDMYAICGMSCRFPGANSSNPEDFFKSLCDGLDAISTVPEGWDCKTRYAALLNPIDSDLFDPKLYGLTKSEAECMDPHQRILLDLAYEALTDSGLIDVESKKGLVVGVFVGLCNNEWITTVNEINPYTGMSTAQSAAANRISYTFGLTGPSIVIDTACSSSLAALHTACNALKCGDCDVAIVAAADLLISSNCLKVREVAGMLSSDNKTKTFDNSADGYVRGEGAGVVIVRRLIDIREDIKTSTYPKQVLAIIRGVSMNQDGYSASFTAPNGESQKKLIKNALNRAGVLPSDISYIETHGTGTSLGDPIEWSAIKEIFLDNYCQYPLILGSVKTNIGHLEGAAGIAGLIKSIMIIQKRIIPKNRNFKEFNSLIETNNMRKCILPQDNIMLESRELSVPLMIGVSSFGSGGTNVHLILQSIDSDILSSPSDLCSIHKSNEYYLNDVTVFLFTGQGMIYQNLGKFLYNSNSIFRSSLIKYSKLFPGLSPSLIEVMYPSDDFNISVDINSDPVYSQIALVATQLGLISYWKSCNIIPSYVIGHSIGEYAAAVAVNAFSEETALKLVYERAVLLNRYKCNELVGMLAIRVSEQVVNEIIEFVQSQSPPGTILTVAAVNGPQSVVLSGHVSALKKVQNKLNSVSSKFLDVSNAFHSPLMVKPAEEFKLIFNQIIELEGISDCKRSDISIISCLTGDIIPTESLRRSSYWEQQMLNTVRFFDCINTLTNQVSNALIIELGPHSTLINMGKACSNTRNFSWFESLNKNLLNAEDFQSHIDSIIAYSNLNKFAVNTKKTYSPIALPWRHRVLLKGQTTNFDNAIIDNSKFLKVVKATLIDFIPISILEDEINLDTNILSLGMDSLSAIAFRNTLTKRLNISKDSVSHSHLFTSYQTVGKLVKYLEDHDSRQYVNVFTKSFYNEQIVVPATFIQQGMLYHTLADIGLSRTSFIETFIWDIVGTVDIKLLKLSFIDMQNYGPSIVFDKVNPESLAYLIYTSGSTGVPKGVCCHHKGAVNTILDLNDRFNVTANDKILALSSLSFDLSVYDIFGLLQAGGTIVIPPASTVSPPDPSFWYDAVLSQGITIWNTVPAFMELLVSHVEYSGLRLPNSLRLIYLSGDWIPINLPARIRAVSDNKDIRIISMGGATEASIWSNIYEIGKENDGIPLGWTSVPYGRPMRNQSMYILNDNDHMNHCNVWVTGSIYIGGVGVASGYYLNPDKTAAQFVNHPKTGEFLFRTGDLGRVRPDGLIEILGREDSQVKVNGFRIELGEIEKVITSHYSVSTAALAVFDNILCAYMVKCSGGDVLSDDLLINSLKVLCHDNLPKYMLPKHFKIIEKIPLSSNGKVQRNLLPKPIAQIDNSELNFTELSPLEIEISNIWSAILGVTSSSIFSSTNFFSIGGDSLRSLQVIAHAKKLGINISVRQIFSYPTLRELSDFIKSLPKYGPVVLGTSSEEISSKPIFSIETEDTNPYEPYPLIGINQAHYVGLHTSSFSQNGLTPQIYFEWEIKEALNVKKFESSINCFVKRHPTFRSIVRNDGYMQVLNFIPYYKIEAINEFVNEATSVDIAMSTRNEMMTIGPDVYEWPLFEFRVSHIKPNVSIIHVTVSLFLMDAMSDLIFRQELSSLYRSSNDTYVDESVLPPKAKIQFKNYCKALLTDLPKSDVYARAKEYWLSRIPNLSSGPELPMLPLSSFNAGTFKNQHRWLNVNEWKFANRNCSVHAVTMPAVLLAAYSIVLARWGSKEKFLLNILQCLRHQVHEDVNKMVGNCSSTILCDIDLSTPVNKPLTFKLAVQRVADELSTNLEHASMSGVEVMQELNRIQGRTFKAVAPFIFTTPIGVEKGNKQVSSRDWMFQENFFSERVPHTACVNAIKADPNGSACASLDIVDGVFYNEVVTGMFSTYDQILDIICSSNPSIWDDPLSNYVPYPNAVVSDNIESLQLSCSLLHEISFLKSTNFAVTYWINDEKYFNLTYGDINRKITALSYYLLLSVPIIKSVSQRVIAVIMEKGWEQVVAVMSIELIGCIYLPIDAKLWPEQRIRTVLEISEASAILSQNKTILNFPWLSNLLIPIIDVSKDLDGFNISEALHELNHLKKQNPESLAYLIYTSGSTGVPKGVCCHHKGAVNTILDLNDRFNVTANDKILALSSLSFDLSVYDIFGLLQAGGTIVIPPASTVSPPDPSFWYDAVLSQGITIWNTVPAFMELLVSHVEYSGLRLPNSLRLIYLSGDWIPINLPARIRAVSDNKDIRIISMGGATEASIWSNIYEIGKENDGIPLGWTSVPYGRPMRNQSMYILNDNDHMNHCNVWVTGSIYIGGVGVASGYYLNPDKTAAQFVNHPKTGEFLFRTGDLGRVRPDGLIEILGREDSQVKVNGFRIELGEIERTLQSHNNVLSSVLTVHKNSLCAYVILSDESELDESVIFNDLKSICEDNLADYMIPKYFMRIYELPLSSNGKVDKLKLPVPDSILAIANSSTSDNSNRLFIYPKDNLENTIRQAYATVLSLNEDQISCHQNFFELGGNSITAIQLIHKLKQSKLSITIQNLFQHPTIISLSQLLKSDTENVYSKTKSSIQSICLKKGSRLDFPIFTVNPAGASVLCYRELVDALNSDSYLYGLDDGVIIEDKEYQFNSIEDVAIQCLQEILLILKRDLNIDIILEDQSKITIILMGWSYGGVVCAEIAKLIKSNHSNIAVDILILFDSALRSPNKLNISDNRDEMLELYHNRPIESKPLSCDIWDIRPKQTNYNCGINAVKEITSGLIHEKLVDGNHWTMLFHEN
eukprot:gene19301-25162_t